MKTTLIIGGARSGKSNFAQELARNSGGKVLFVATAEAGDEEMRRRIETHRKARPAGWKTLEATARVGSRILEGTGGADTVIVDCITLLVSNVFLKYGGHTVAAIDEALIEKGVMTEIEGLVASIDKVAASFIIVTNEVGLDLVPPNPVGRLYRDLLGKTNQMLAQRADEVYLMVAGIPVQIKPAATR